MDGWVGECLYGWVNGRNERSKYLFSLMENKIDLFGNGSISLLIYHQSSSCSKDLDIG